MSDKNIIISPLYLHTQETVRIPILNINSYPITLYANTALGKIYPVSEVYSCTNKSVTSDISNDNSKLPKVDINDKLETDEQQDLLSLIQSYSDIFATSDLDIGAYTGEDRMSIDTGDSPPVNIPPYRKSHTERQVLREYIQKFLKLGIIEESTSNYASPILLVKKKEANSYRIVIDYRQLNSKTKDQIFPMPRLADIFDSLYKAQYFSKMDISNGFFNFFVKEEDKHKTSFVTIDGSYQFLRVPQGLKNSPAFFNRVLRKIFANLLFAKCLLYLDDILVFANSFREHLEALEAVFQKLRHNGLKLKPSKCSFGYQEIIILGHKISNNGIEVDPSKVDAVVRMPAPKNISEVRSFLGMASYYRRFIHNFSIIAKPILDLTKKDSKFEWSEACQISFDLLKERLTTAPILKQFNESLPVTIFSDASATAIGCVLAQNIDGKEHVIAYASRVLNPAEIKWSIAERECLGVLYALHKFHEYCHNRPVTVLTDHHCLCSLLRTKHSKNLRIARWALEVQSANINVVYRKGTLHGNADCLSRLVPLSLPAKGFESVFNASTSAPKEDSKKLDYRSKLKLEQHIDKYFGNIIEQLGTQNCSRKLNERYVLIDNILYYINPIDKVRKICIPSRMITDIFKAHHNSILGGGHVGFHRTYARIKAKFYIRKLRKLLVSYLNNCLDCAKRNPSNKQHVGRMVPGEIYDVFDKWMLDVLGPLKETSRGNKYVFVAACTFSKYVVAEAVKEATALTLSNFISRHIFLHFGVPSFIQFDNSSINRSKLLQEVMAQVNCKPIFHFAVYA